ncbi:MAG: drug/metabolite transporter (DMT)-like permease [Planctomycetota bacterium]|jgi:drug/metabolite transporter (DMT)-like permease
MSEDTAEHERQQKNQGIIALVVVQICFGLFPLFGKLTMEGFDPRALAGWRMLFGALILGGYAFFRLGKRAFPTWPDLFRLQICAFLGISVNQVLYLEGLQRAPTVNAALVMCLIPVLTLIIAIMIRQEKFEKGRALGTLIAFAGLVYLVVHRGVDLDDAYLQGNLLMCANALSYSIYLVYSRPLSRRYPAYVVIGWVFILSTWQVPLFIGGAEFFPEAASTDSWLALVYVLLFPTTLAYFLNVFALARVRASTTAIFIFSQPIIAAIAALLFLDEPLTAATIFSGIAIFVGIWLASGRSKPRQ